MRFNQRLGSTTYQWANSVVHDKQLIICRCEEVTLAQIDEAKRSGAGSVNELKLRTRAAMGACQGRTCLRLLATLCSGTAEPPRDTATSRWPVRPVRFEALVRHLPTQPESQIPLMELELPDLGGRHE